MSEFRYYHPIQVRYGDLDPQWHVNNTKTLVYIEQARFAYYRELGIFDGVSFMDLGFIVADVHVAYLAPIPPTAKVRVGVRVAYIGNKSLRFESQVEDEASGLVYARSEIIMVTFDYHTQASIRVPDNVRAAISAYERVSFQ